MLQMDVNVLTSHKFNFNACHTLKMRQERCLTKGLFFARSQPTISKGFASAEFEGAGGEKLAIFWVKTPISMLLVRLPPS